MGEASIDPGKESHVRMQHFGRNLLSCGYERFIFPSCVE